MIPNPIVAIGTMKEKGGFLMGKTFPFNCKVYYIFKHVFYFFPFEYIHNNYNKRKNS